MSFLSTLLRSTLLRSTFTILALSCTLPLILPFQAFSANPILTYPSDTPSGQIPGGTFNTYFSNMFGSGCTTSLTAITGFNYHGPFNTQNGIPICTDFTEPVSTLIDTAITEHHTSVFGTGNISDLFSCKPTGTGKENACYGTGVLQKNTLGQFNTALGHFSLQQNTTGNFNTTVGTRSLTSNISGNHNTALGVRAGLALITGSNNLLLGYQAGKNLTTGNHNIALGTDTLFSSSTGSYQLNIGNTLLGTLNPTPTSTGGTLHVQGRIYTSNPTPLKPNELASKAYVDSKLRAGGGGGMNMDGVDVMVSDETVKIFSSSFFLDDILQGDEEYYMIGSSSHYNAGGSGIYCVRDGVASDNILLYSAYAFASNRGAKYLGDGLFVVVVVGGVYPDYLKILNCETGVVSENIEIGGGNVVYVYRHDENVYIGMTFSSKKVYVKKYNLQGIRDTSFDTHPNGRLMQNAPDYYASWFTTSEGGIPLVVGCYQKDTGLSDPNRKYATVCSVYDGTDFSLIKNSPELMYGHQNYGADPIDMYDGDIIGVSSVQGSGIYFVWNYMTDVFFKIPIKNRDGVIAIGSGRVLAIDRFSGLLSAYDDQGEQIMHPRSMRTALGRIRAQKLGRTSDGLPMVYGWKIHSEYNGSSSSYNNMSHFITVWRAIFPVE